MVRYKRSQSDLVSTINITPFTDVILVLLIVFMISAPGLYMSSFRIQLPGSQAAAQDSRFSLIVVLDQEGELFLSDRKISVEELKERLAGLEQDRKERILLNADERLAHGKVIYIVDVLREAGAGSVSVGTVPQ